MEIALPDRLIDAIYDAALDHTALPDALEIIGAQFRGVDTRVVLWDLQAGKMLPDIRSDVVADVVKTPLRSTIAKTSPMLSFATRIPLHKAVDQAMQLGGIDSFKSLDIYADAYRPQRHMPMFGTVLMRSPQMLAGLSLFRPDHWPLAGAAEMRWASASRAMSAARWNWGGCSRGTMPRRASRRLSKRHRRRFCC